MITLPFPSSSLSGHSSKHYRVMRPIIAKHRDWARKAALAAKYHVQPEGDIQIHITFYPPNNRGDRLNYPNRMKAYFDGIADALGVNDKRFVPHFYFCAPEKPGRVEVRIGA